MIFQMHTCTLKSRSVAEVEARFQRALADRVRLSPLGGFWRTEVGVLNQIMALWPYADEADRARVQAGLKAIPGWLPDIREFILDENELCFCRILN